MDRNITIHVQRESALDLPPGYFLAQIGEHQQVTSNNPAVIVLEDEANTVFEDQWQYFLYACNLGMAKNNVTRLISVGVAFMNRTGVGDKDNPRENVITGEKLGLDHPYLDKLRTCALATHAVREYDSTHYQILTLDGNASPPMKPGRARPRSVDDIDRRVVTIDDYLYTPRTHPWFFIACNIFNEAVGPGTEIVPFPNGLQYAWAPSRDVYTWFPLVDHHDRPLLTLKSLWRRVGAYQRPYRK